MLETSKSQTHFKNIKYITLECKFLKSWTPDNKRNINN